MAPTIGAMTPRTPTSRERGRALLSRINRWMIAGAVGLAGVFSVVAAEASHGKTTGSTTTTLQQPSTTPSAGSSSTSSGSSTSSSSPSSDSSSSSGSSGVVSGGS
jgi:cytoskeletal protein RodZ